MKTPIPAPTNFEFQKSGAVLVTWEDRQSWSYRLVCACSEPIQIGIEDEFGTGDEKKFRGLHCMFSHRGKWWKSVYGADLKPHNIMYGCLQVMQRSAFGCNFTWSKEVHDWLCNVELEYEG